ncbi:MAG: hypothetical protein EZS28_017728 [Streblomastix strix]|uniref:Uncharacterized protein n=1 Tax=Streblomastix strix TaxID=222440 RepID=A0A5J4VVV4_9EUKA|nr:MAG: hypothetical protein EZS28_017728 [Streblomastix strix]
MEKAITQPIKQLFNELVKQHFNDNDTIKVTIEALQNLLKNGASNGQVNYSAGNPILWGVNSVGTECGFYSDGPKIYWRAKPVTLGSVPP